MLSSDGDAAAEREAGDELVDDAPEHVRRSRWRRHGRAHSTAVTTS
jgi:hypothetical protein